MERARYIAVEGPIGVGKTAFARILAAKLGARFIGEPDDNPFLGGFYQDPRRFAFQTQLFYLLSRYQRHADLKQDDLFSQGGVVTDYLFQRDRVFAQLTLSPSELSLYDKVFRLLDTHFPRPDLVVYLQARPEVLLERIRRAASDEGKPARALTADYLDEVARGYADFFFQYTESPLLIVNTSEIDFVADPANPKAAPNTSEVQDDLVAVIRRTKAGISHYNPLGTR